MADNYLEKKYEEYKSRKEGRTNHPYNGRKTTVIHKTRRVFVTGGAEGKSFPFRRTPRGVLRP